jgi:formamidopyrimidine-DNA glycosylase
MMPEGPECKRIGDALQLYAGWTINSIKILSGRYRTGEPPKGLVAFSEQLLPAVIQRVGTKGKFIYMVCASECGRRNGSIWSTLGMTGRWALAPEPYSRVRLDIESPDGRWHPSAVYSQSGRPFAPASDHPADAVIEGFRVRHVADRVAVGLHFIDQRNFGTLRFRRAAATTATITTTLLPDRVGWW